MKKFLRGEIVGVGDLLNMENFVIARQVSWDCIYELDSAGGGKGRKIIQ